LRQACRWESGSVCPWSKHCTASLEALPLSLPALAPCAAQGQQQGPAFEPSCPCPAPCAFEPSCPYLALVLHRVPLSLPALVLHRALHRGNLRHKWLELQQPRPPAAQGPGRRGRAAALPAPAAGERGGTSQHSSIRGHGRRWRLGAGRNMPSKGTH